jgi:hypothetical protein
MSKAEQERGASGCRSRRRHDGAMGGAADGADVGRRQVPTTLRCVGGDSASVSVLLRVGVITNEGIESTA